MTAKKKASSAQDPAVITDAEPKKAARAEVDWELIERQYRAGTQSVRQLADTHGVSHTLINRKAKQQGWVKDLGPAVKAAADRKVLEADAAAAAVSTEGVSTAVSKLRTETETQLIETEAQLQFNVRMQHRRDIAETRNLFNALLYEVKDQTFHLEDLERLGELLDETDVNDRGTLIVDKLNQIYRKVISTPGRVDSAKKLSDILSTVIRLEREAFGIGADAGGMDDMESVLDRIAKKRGLLNG